MDIKKRRSSRCTRSRLRSPGRPPVANREERALFWRYVAAGMSSEAAAVKAGASQPVGSRWFREAGGMPPAAFRLSAKPLSGRYLSLAEREEIALLLARGHGVCEIARQLGRAASTISREIRRNAATRSGNFDYRATTAQWHAERAARRPKVARLAANDIATLGRRPSGRCGCQTWRATCRRSGGLIMDGTTTWTAPEPALVNGMEPGADCRASAHRLSG